MTFLCDARPCRRSRCSGCAVALLPLCSVIARPSCRRAFAVAGDVKTEARLSLHDLRAPWCSSFEPGCHPFCLCHLACARMVAVLCLSPAFMLRMLELRSCAVRSSGFQLCAIEVLHSDHTLVNFGLWPRVMIALPSCRPSSPLCFSCVSLVTSAVPRRCACT